MGRWHPSPTGAPTGRLMSDGGGTAAPLAHCPWTHGCGTELDYMIISINMKCFVVKQQKTPCSTGVAKRCGASNCQWSLRNPICGHDQVTTAFSSGRGSLLFSWPSAFFIWALYISGYSSMFWIRCCNLPSITGMLDLVIASLSRINFAQRAKHQLFP